MNDLISREELLDYLQIIPIDLGYREVDDITEYVKNMPSTQPEQKTGYWLPDNNSYYETKFVCSNCKKNQSIPTIMYKPNSCYCMYCGSYNSNAEMRDKQYG